MTRKCIVLSLLFIISFCVLLFFKYSNHVSLKKPLTSIPSKIGEWKMQDREMLKNNIEEMLGVDKYIWRDYVSPKGERINVYVSFFSYISREKSYHSPLNCMPGSGWRITKIKDIPIPLKGKEKVYVRELSLSQGQDRLKALYWYQCRGRIISSEYMERIYRIIDSLLHRRTDGAFVRVLSISPEVGEKEIRVFTSHLILILTKILPS